MGAGPLKFFVQNAGENDQWIGIRHQGNFSSSTCAAESAAFFVGGRCSPIVSSGTLTTFCRSAYWFRSRNYQSRIQLSAAGIDRARSRVTSVPSGRREK